jgi:hypothetical protein
MRWNAAGIVSSFVLIGTACGAGSGGGSAAGVGDAVGGKGGVSARPSGAGGTAAANGSMGSSQFPGSGTSNAGQPLPAGMVCDSVAGQHVTHLPQPVLKCLLPVNAQKPAATLEQVLECASGKDAVHLRLTFDPAFVDNTFGAGSIGWPHRRGHTFVKDLTKSDHAELMASDASGKEVVHFKLDYVSPDPTAASGYGSLGVRGGDGAMITGDPAWIVAWNTSISRNLTERGYKSYTVDSPATDAAYTPNPLAPAWDYRVVYEAWIDVAAFGGAGFGDATIESVHASPSKSGEDTLTVKPGKCPPGECAPDDPRCAGYAGSGGVGGATECPPDDPHCAGYAGSGGVGGGSPDCPPDDPQCTRTGTIGGAPAKEPPPACPREDPSCTPD